MLGIAATPARAESPVITAQAAGCEGGGTKVNELVQIRVQNKATGQIIYLLFKEEFLKQPLKDFIKGRRQKSNGSFVQSLVAKY